MRHTKVFAAVAMASLLLAAIVITSCSRDSSSPTQPVMPSDLTGRLATGLTSTTFASTTPTSAAQTSAGPDLYQAYYDSSIYTITLVPMPENANTAILAHNGQINQIYMSEPNDSESVFVIDAIPTDGMNPMWREFEIHFNEGFTPHQFYSDNQVNDAAAGSNPEITLVPTNEIYRCAVVGHKP